MERGCPLQLGTRVSSTRANRGLPPRGFFQIQPQASHPLRFPRSQEAIKKVTDVQQHQSPTCNREHQRLATSPSQAKPGQQPGLGTRTHMQRAGLSLARCSGCKHGGTSECHLGRPKVGKQCLPCSWAGSPALAGLGHVETFKVPASPAGPLSCGGHHTPSAVGTSTWQAGRREQEVQVVWAPPSPESPCPPEGWPPVSPPLNA